jgi:phytoene/squalene synthetase
MMPFKTRHPLLSLALPAPGGSPFRQTDESTAHAMLKAGHADLAALTQSARSLGGDVMQAQLKFLWPRASEHDLALAKGLGVALWLTEMLLFIREDATAGLIFLPRDVMQKNLVEPAQLTQGKHDFALRRLGEQLAAHSMKILQGSAPLGLSAPFLLRYRLRWTMLYASFVLQAMQRDPNAPFIKPTLPLREALTLLKNTLFVSSSGKTSGKKGGSCGSGGCST